eukprot:jgi/Hompol1/5830/HPOL_002380-RA
MENIIGLVRDRVLSPLLGDKQCAASIASFDFDKLECFKLLISKGLSLGIVAGSSILKVPQIFNIVRAGSARGVSFLSVIIEVVAIAITIAYNYRLENPFSTYGEGVLINLQNAVLLVLILVYNNQSAALLSLGGFLYLLYILLSDAEIVSMALLTSLQWGTIFLGIASKLPQIWDNFSAGSTGQLSSITVLLQFAGTLARVFTTLQEGLDNTILISFVTAAVLNGVVLAQIYVYAGKSKSKFKPKKQD